MQSTRTASSLGRNPPRGPRLSLTMKIMAVKTVPSQMPLFWRMKFTSGHSGGGKSKIKVLVSITISMPIHAVPKGTAAKSTAPGHDEHQILHTGRGLLIQACLCRSSMD
ncbi:uncharacterized protein WM277_018043 isoform 1-T1 [Molossus nigricans]